MTKETLGPDEAWETIKLLIQPLEAERMRVVKSWRRTLAQDVASPADLPQEDRALKDGYAIGPPLFETGEFSIRSFAQSKNPSNMALDPGEALRVRTGAPLPEGTWAVVPRECVEEDLSASKIRVSKGVLEKGSNIGRRGHLARKGDVLLGAGEVLGPGEIALLSSAGIAHVMVSKRPLVGIIPTGSELAVPEDSGERYGPGQSFVSYVWYLAWRVREEGGIPKVFHPVPDVAKRLRKSLESAARNAQLIVTTGGTGGSEMDLVGGTILSMGAEEIFRYPKIRPGRTISAFLLEGVPVICLPGGAGGVGVGCELLVVPCIKRLQGRRLEGPRWVECHLASGITSGGEAYRFVEVRIEIREGLLLAHAVRDDWSKGNISPLLGHGFLELPPGRRSLRRGEVARLLLRGSAL